MTLKANRVAEGVIVAKELGEDGVLLVPVGIISTLEGCGHVIGEGMDRVVREFLL